MNESQKIASHFIEVAPRMIRIVKEEITRSTERQLTHPQYRILASIQRGLNSISLLAADQGVSQPAMSKNVEILVSRKLILRSLHSKDRRQTVLRLSTRGQTLFQHLKASAAESLGHRVESLSRQHQKQLSAALKALEVSLQLLPHSWDAKKFNESGENR